MVDEHEERALADGSGVTFVAAATVALRGRLSMSDISPKDSPAPSRTERCSS